MCLALAGKARSRQLLTAARLLSASWFASMAAWRWLEAELRALAFLGVDLLLAAAFLRMSRGRVFPAPLCFLHAGLALYHLYALAVGSSIGWVAAFINRAFELALFYVVACAAYRIGRLRRKEKGAPAGRAFHEG